MSHPEHPSGASEHSTRNALLQRLRDRAAAGDLDPQTEQLLRDAEAALVRDHASVCGLALVRDASRTDCAPGPLSREALIEAALNHSAETSSSAFVMRVPATSPELVVCLGQPIDLVNMLADMVGTV